MGLARDPRRRQPRLERHRRVPRGARRQARHGRSRTADTPLVWAEGVFLATHPPQRKPETDRVARAAAARARAQPLTAARMRREPGLQAAEASSNIAPSAEHRARARRTALWRLNRNGGEAAARPPAFGVELDDLMGYNLRRAHGVQKSRFETMFGPLGIRPVTLSVLGHDLRQSRTSRRPISARSSTSSARTWCR